MTFSSFYILNVSNYVQKHKTTKWPHCQNILQKKSSDRTNKKIKQDFWLCTVINLYMFRIRLEVKKFNFVLKICNNCNFKLKLTKLSKYHQTKCGRFLLSQSFPKKILNQQLICNSRCVWSSQCCMIVVSC